MFLDTLSLNHHFNNHGPLAFSMVDNVNKSTKNILPQKKKKKNCCSLDYFPRIDFPEVGLNKKEGYSYNYF